MGRVVESVSVTGNNVLLNYEEVSLGLSVSRFQMKEGVGECMNFSGSTSGV